MTSTKRQAPDDKHQMTSTKRQAPKSKVSYSAIGSWKLEVGI